MENNTNIKKQGKLGCAGCLVWILIIGLFVGIVMSEDWRNEEAKEKIIHMGEEGVRAVTGVREIGFENYTRDKLNKRCLDLNQNYNMIVYEGATGDIPYEELITPLSDGALEVTLASAFSFILQDGAEVMAPLFAEYGKRHNPDYTPERPMGGMEPIYGTGEEVEILFPESRTEDLVAEKDLVTTYVKRFMGRNDEQVMADTLEYFLSKDIAYLCVFENIIRIGEVSGKPTIDIILTEDLEQVFRVLHDFMWTPDYDEYREVYPGGVEQVAYVSNRIYGLEYETINCDEGEFPKSIYEHEGLTGARWRRLAFWTE